MAVLLLLAGCGKANKASDNEKLTAEQRAPGQWLDYVPFKDSVKSERWGLVNLEGKVLCDSLRRKPSNVVNGIFYMPNERGLYEYYVVGEQFKKLAGQYTRAGLFYEDIAPCVEQGKSYIQFIRRDGTVAFVLDTLAGRKVEWVGRFSEGLAPVKAGNLIGYINLQGQIVIEPRFVEAGPFSEGLAVVVDTAGGNLKAYQQKETYRISVIDQQGQPMSYSFDSTDSLGLCFSGGVLSRCYQKDDTTRICEFVNHQGQLQIPSQPFYHSVTSAVGTHYGFFNGTVWGVADNLGSTILSPIYDAIVSIDETTVTLCEYGLYKIKDYRGMQLSKSYNAMLPLSGSHCYLAKRSDRWFIVDEEGMEQGSSRYLIESVEPEYPFIR